MRRPNLVITGAVLALALAPVGLIVGCEDDPAPMSSSSDAEAGAPDSSNSSDGPPDNDASTHDDVNAPHVPGDPFLVGPPPDASAQDEDPALLRARDGTLHVAWYSNRLGTQPENGDEDKEIFVASRKLTSAAWTAPVQATRNVARAFYPSMTDDKNGTRHLAWWRVIVGPPGCTIGVTCNSTDNRIVYKTSPDGLSWDLANASAETEITTGPGDWLPNVVYDAAGDRVLVYFAAVARDAAGAVNKSLSTTRIFVIIQSTATGGGGGGVWSAVTPLIGGVSEGTSHNSYPYVVQRPNGSYLMTWTRFDLGSNNDPSHIVEVPSTNTMTATSTDGITWSDIKTLSDGVSGDAGALDVFPVLYADRPSGEPLFFTSWISTAFGGAKQIELPFGPGVVYPKDVIQRPEVLGYTAKLVATTTPDVFFSVWVKGSNPSQKIEGRFFRR